MSSFWDQESVLPIALIEQSASIAKQDPRPAQLETEDSVRELSSIERRFVRQIEKAIARCPIGGLHHLHIKLTDQAVLLEGECRTFYAKQMAQETVMAITARKVVNHLVVD
jgi:hypothetical protein